MKWYFLLLSFVFVLLGLNEKSNAQYYFYNEVEIFEFGEIPELNLPFAIKTPARDSYGRACNNKFEE